MKRSTTMFSLTLPALALALSVGSLHAQAGGRPAGAAAPAVAATGGVATADAKDFMGVWDIAFTGAQPITVALNIRDQAGKVAATSTMQGADSQVTTIAKNQTALVLNYSIDFQGMPIPIILTLTPGADGIAAALDAAGGMYTASGKAVKRP